mmetsp:Transcript_13123/g.41876  ORF Transcript_13123/g.41876 Transcript_13123/m.41876 type:complete len:360 (+) Transcript_13123:549-1628(+)
MSGRQSWSQRQGRGPITHPGYECPVGRQYGKHSIWEPDARESSAAAAECPALTCATCSGLRLTVASAAAGCFRMAVLSRPDIVSWSVTKLGHWDIRSPEQIFGRYALPASGALLDVGSNLGWFSWLFAQSGRRVYAVEAFPTNQRAYRTTLCLNPAWNGSVTLAATAVGGPDAAGPCVVSGSAGDNAGNGVLRCGRAEGCEAARAGGLSCEPATLTTLDSLLEGWGDPRFAVVKMDVEGAECDVLRGGQRLFSRSPPRFLYAELKQPHVEACWRETALRHGYRAATPWRGKDRNLLFVHEEAPAVPAGPLGLYSNSCCGWTPESRLLPCNFACTSADAHFDAATHRWEPIASRTAASGG